MAQQPRLHALIPDDLGILVPAPREHHREDLTLAPPARLRIEHPPGVAKIDLCLTAGGHLHPHKRLHRGRLQMGHQAAHRAVGPTTWTHYVDPLRGPTTWTHYVDPLRGPTTWTHYV